MAIEIIEFPFRAFSAGFLSGFLTGYLIKLNINIHGYKFKQKWFKDHKCMWLWYLLDGAGLARE